MKNIAVRTNTVCKFFGEGETCTEVLKDLAFGLWLTFAFLFFAAVIIVDLLGRGR